MLLIRHPSNVARSIIQSITLMHLPHRRPVIFVPPPWQKKSRFPRAQPCLWHIMVEFRQKPFFSYPHIHSPQLGSKVGGGWSGCQGGFPKQGKPAQLFIGQCKQKLRGPDREGDRPESRGDRADCLISSKQEGSAGEWQLVLSTQEHTHLAQRLTKP